MFPRQFQGSSWNVGGNDGKNPENSMSSSQAFSGATFQPVDVLLLYAFVGLVSSSIGISQTSWKIRWLLLLTSIFWNK